MISNDVIFVTNAFVLVRFIKLKISKIESSIVRQIKSEFTVRNIKINILDNN